MPEIDIGKLGNGIVQSIDEQAGIVEVFGGNGKQEVFPVCRHIRFLKEIITADVKVGINIVGI